MSARTSQNVKIAVISAITSVITALIAAGATVWVAGERREIKDKVQAERAEEILTSPADKPAAVRAAAGGDLKRAAGGTLELAFLQTMTATVTYDDNARKETEGPVKADICVLTSVGSYGGATKGCSLTKEANGWVLVSNGRKATSACTATCFNLQPRT